MRNTSPGPTVFVVDDDEAVRDSLVVLLENKGYAVRAFDSASGFLAQHSAELHGCLLLDIRMPGMDGMALLKQLATSGTSLPIIMITGHGDVPTAVKAMHQGAFDFLEKPFTQDIILDSVTRALQVGEQGDEARAAVRAVAARFERLTDREREVLDRMVEGMTSKEIARKLEISPRTVEIHRARIMEKTEARTLSNLVRMALTAGLG